MEKAEFQETPIVSTNAVQVESFFSPSADDETDFYYDEETQTKYHECYCFHVPELAHNVIKFLLFSFNILFWILSFALIILGIWAITVNIDYGNTFDSVVMSPSVLLIALGVLIFLVSFCGCVGALRENTYLLKGFVAVMGIGLILQLVLVIIVFSLQDRMQPLLNKFFIRSIKAYQDDVDLKNLVDYMQHQFECCGGESMDEWDADFYFSCDSLSMSKCGVPYSCCKGFGTTTNNTMCGFGVRSQVIKSGIFSGGCTNRILVYITENLTTVAIVLLLFFLPQILGMFLAVTFMGQVDDEIVYWKQKQELEKRGYYRRPIRNPNFTLSL